MPHTLTGHPPQLRARMHPHSLFSGILEPGLRHNRVRVIEMGTSTLAVLKMTRFTNVTVATLELPAFTLEWQSDPSERGRAYMLIDLDGGVRVTQGEAYSQGTHIHVLPPGYAPITISSAKRVSKLLYVAFPSALLAGYEFPLSRGSLTEEPDLNLLLPYLSFLTSICDAKLPSTTALQPLQQPTRQMLTALLGLIFTGQPHEDTMFTHITRAVLTTYADPKFSVHTVAKLLNVSVKTVQVECRRHNVRFVSLLSHVRACAAAHTRATEPNLAPAVVAQRSGFGSVPSLYRALGQLEQAMQEHEHGAVHPEFEVLDPRRIGDMEPRTVGSDPSLDRAACPGFKNDTRPTLPVVSSPRPEHPAYGATAPGTRPGR